MPTEQMIRYFQAASSDPRVLREPTRKRGHDGGGLDGDPEHPQVGGEHGEEHGGDETLHQDGIGRRARRRHGAGRQVEGDGADPEPRGEERDCPITTTMKALSASARRTPPARSPDRGRATRTARVTPSANVAPLVATAAQRRPPRRGAAATTAPRAGGRRGRVGPALVPQLLELVEVHVAELDLQTPGEDHQHHHTQEDVEGDPSSMRNGTPAVERNATRAIPLST